MNAFAIDTNINYIWRFKKLSLLKDLTIKNILHYYYRRWNVYLAHTQINRSNPKQIDTILLG